jgi:hypothetical protein
MSVTTSRRLSGCCMRSPPALAGRQDTDFADWNLGQRGQLPSAEAPPPDQRERLQLRAPAGDGGAFLCCRPAVEPAGRAQRGC